MNNKAIAQEINYDIEKGIYDAFPKLKNRLEHIAHKLVLVTYIVDRELTSGEIKTLKENNYI
jgi:hypothetical protein